jgi:hypothetical protein
MSTRGIDTMLTRHVFLLVIGASAASAQAAPVGTWRFERGVAAPWIHAGAPAPDTHRWLGQTMRAEGDQVTGPGILSCTKGSWVTAPQPAEGLFQGNLPAPARKAAEALGVTHFPVPGTRLTCSSGSFDFHRVDETTMLMALDNVIWTLSRAPGTSAPATTPNGMVQRFLERHFAGDMGFDNASIASKQEWLAPSLRTAIAKYLARPASPNEEPAIDGDPFTDSQEYPTRFAVGAAAISGPAATVPVRFSDGFRTRSVTYLLRQDAGQWRISDVRWGTETLARLLK